MMIFMGGFGVSISYHPEGTKNGGGGLNGTRSGPRGRRERASECAKRGAFEFRGALNLLAAPVTSIISLSPIVSIGRGRSANGFCTAVSRAWGVRGFGHVNDGIKPLTVAATIEGDVERDEMDARAGPRAAP